MFVQKRFKGEAAILGFIGSLAVFLCALTSETLPSEIKILVGIGMLYSGVNAIYEGWRLAKKQEEDLRSTKDQDYS